MNPFKYAQMMKYLTRAKKQKPDLPDVFPASQAPIPKVKEDVETMEAVNRFVRDNPRTGKAGGGMLVQPGFGGTRQGYARPKGSVSKSGPKYEKRMKVKNYLTNLPDNSSISVLDLASELKVSRSLIDNILKEKQFKNKKFNLLRRTGSLTNKQFATEYKNFQKSDFFKTGADEEFADYLNDLGFKPQEGEGKFTPGNVGSRRRTLNIKSVATKAVALTDKQILKEAKRLKIKNIKSLSSSELRNKVITARAKENTAKKMKENLEFREQQRKKQKIRMDKFIKKRMSTVEGRAQLLKERRKSKQLEYQRKGLDPLATNADEAIWRDAVLTANKNADGKGRFSIDSGYSKSMKAEDYFSNKIKIKDNQTNKTFTFNTFKNYVNKNASSFGLKNYDEAVKSYRQKFFINDKPNLRNSINFALIPNYNEAMPTSAYTIQHDFGRQNNPLKTSLAFYDDNLNEYRIRTDFENAWAASKKSKTPLTDRKKAFNVFKKDLAKLNIQSVPSMVKRERFFGKGLDLTDILKTAKKEGATLPRGLLKEAAEFDKQLINQIAVLGGGDCGRGFKNQGGRVGLRDGTPSVDVCFKNATQRINSGFKNATPAEARNYTKLLNAVKGSAVIGRNLLKFGIVPEALYVGADSLIRMGFGDTFKEAGLRASDFFIPGDQMQEADRLKVQRTLGDAAATNVGKVFDYRNQIANIDSLEQQKQNLANLSEVGEFDYVGDLSQDIKNIDTRLNQAKNDLQNKFMVSEAETVAADRALEEAYDISKAKSPLARLKSFAQNIEAVQDDPFLSDIATPQKKQEELNLNMFPTMPRGFLTEKTSDLLDRTQALKQSGYNVSTRDLMAEQERLKSIPLSQDVITYGPEQMYGAQGTFFGQPLAGGGIAKLAGVSSGPPPESGPMSQGLQGLMKRVRNL